MNFRPSDVLKRRFCLLPLCCLLALSGLPGCQSKSPWDRVPLQGTAQLDEKPFSGSISLRPQPGVSGPAVTTTVDQGKFRFDTDNGPVRGAHSVMLMPEKIQRDDVAVSAMTTVPDKEPFQVEITAQSPQQDPVPPLTASAEAEQSEK